MQLGIQTLLLLLLVVLVLVSLQGEESLQLELSKTDSYEDVSKALAARLGLDHPLKLRLTGTELHWCSRLIMLHYVANLGCHLAPLWVEAAEGAAVAAAAVMQGQQPAGTFTCRCMCLLGRRTGREAALHSHTAAAAAVAGRCPACALLQSRTI